jgi:hypothetical protein
LSRIYVRIPAYCCQFFIHLSNFDALVQSRQCYSDPYFPGGDEWEPRLKKTGSCPPF